MALVKELYGMLEVSVEDKYRRNGNALKSLRHRAFGGLSRTCVSDPMLHNFGFLLCLKLSNKRQ